MKASTLRRENKIPDVTHKLAAEALEIEKALNMADRVVFSTRQHKVFPASLRLALESYTALRGKEGFQIVRVPVLHLPPAKGVSLPQFSVNTDQLKILNRHSTAQFRKKYGDLLVLRYDLQTHRAFADEQIMNFLVEFRAHTKPYLERLLISHHLEITTVPQLAQHTVAQRR